VRPWLRRTLFIAGGLLMLGVLGIGALLGLIASSMPSAQGPRVEIREGVVGVETGGSYAWIVRTEHGAALVDSGMDPQASALLDELQVMGLGADDVHTILLTHAHGDHTGGLGAFPRATVVHGPGEAALLAGEDVPLGLAPSLMAGLMPDPVLPAEVVEAADGQVLDVDGDVVTVVSTPGHTLGSTTYQWGDVLFVGDAVFNAGEGQVMVSPSFLNSDNDAAQASARRLGPLDAEWMADGHGGRTANADAALDALGKGGT